MKWTLTALAKAAQIVYSVIAPTPQDGWPLLAETGLDRSAPIVWYARLVVGVFELINKPASRTCPCVEAVYQALARRALAGERFTFPAALPAPALPPPLADAERADAQRWALDLSQIADPAARQHALATAPAHWPLTIRHDLAWQVGRAALRATRRSTELSLSTNPAGVESTGGGLGSATQVRLRKANRINQL